ncbi:hypothetical protein Bpla01_09330 [Burkholderia plantarii]|nr:hypothetical protein Bpla01_09330 [Burkholderia plantarii]
MRKVVPSMAHRLNPLKARRAASCWRQARAVRLNSHAIGASPSRGRACAAVDDFADRPVAVDRRSDHEPDHLLGGQATTANAGRAGRLDCRCDPFLRPVRARTAQVRGRGIEYETQGIARHGDPRWQRVAPFTTHTPNKNAVQLLN